MDVFEVVAGSRWCFFRGRTVRASHDGNARNLAKRRRVANKGVISGCCYRD